MILDGASLQHINICLLLLRNNAYNNRNAVPLFSGIPELHNKGDLPTCWKPTTHHDFGISSGLSHPEWTRQSSGCWKMGQILGQDI